MQPGVFLRARAQGPKGAELTPRGNVAGEACGQDGGVQQFVVRVPIDRRIGPKRIFFVPRPREVGSVKDADLLQLVQELQAHGFDGDHCRYADVVPFRPRTRRIPSFFIFDISELVISDNLSQSIRRTRNRLSDVLRLISHARRIVEQVPAAEVGSSSHDRVKAAHHHTHDQHPTILGIEKKMTRVNKHF